MKDIEKIVNKFSKILSLTKNETKNLFKETLEQENYEDAIINLIGFDNIEDAMTLCTEKDFFEINQEEKQEEQIKQVYKYTEHILPMDKRVEVSEDELVPTSKTGEDSKYFNFKKFNFVQSVVFDLAYKSDTNILVSAPTGAGKTEIAMLTILRALKSKNSKIVYIVPMKALATEITNKLQNKLRGYTVTEYTGDTEIKWKEVQKSDILVCTPEKFDVSTRKQDNIFNFNLKLIIIDEIHILQDERGPVIETIVARTLRYIEIKQENIRIVGLSATLPNYEDVASFIRADGLFHFNTSYRPVPLKLSIIGLNKKHSKGDDFIDENRMIDVVLEKLSILLNENQQVLIFVHSRSETLKTAKRLIKELKNENHIERISMENIKTNKNLVKELVAHGFGIHHAGLPREIRLEMEESFKSGTIRVLVCTSTLAWGVNLPAHAVIIKGTKYYNADKGGFCDLGILDILQIFGRAGRPQYDTFGEAYLITSGSKLKNYLSLIKNQIPIESKFLNQIVDLLNAEISLNTISTVRDACSWIKNTFLYIRILKNPFAYGFSAEEIRYKQMEKVLREYVVLAAKRLNEHSLIEIEDMGILSAHEYDLWTFIPTQYGIIASTFYISHETMGEWMKELPFVYDEQSVLTLILKSVEFKSLILRSDEERVIEGICKDLGLIYENSIDCKLNVLVYCYVRYIPIHMFSLVCDTSFIIKNLKRLISGFESIILYEKRYETFEHIFNLNKKILRQKKSFLKKKVNYEIKKINDFYNLNVNLESEDTATLFVYREKEVIYSTYFKQADSSFIPNEFDKIKIVGDEEYWIWEQKVCRKAEKDDLSYHINMLHYWGLHFCNETSWTLNSIKKECKHFKILYGENDYIKLEEMKNFLVLEDRNLPSVENNHISIASDCITKIVDNGTFNDVFISIKMKLKLYFIGVEVRNEREREKLMTSMIYNKIKKMKENILIVVSSIGEMKKTVEDIRRRKVLYECANNNIIMNDEKFGVFSGVIKNYKIKGIFITTLEEALKIRNECFVIFKGCKTHSGNLYPISKMMTVLNARESLIYESNNYIDFLRKSFE